MDTQRQALLPPALPLLDFNISHHGNWTVLVAAENAHVGIDVMKVAEPFNQSVEEFLDTLRAQFTEHEWLVITAPKTEMERLHRLYRHWCLKESYVKAKGLGLQLDLRSIEFRMSSTEDDAYGDTQVVKTKTSLCINGVHQVDWHFEEMYLDQHHCVAVAYSSISVCDIGLDSGEFKIANVEEILQHARPV